MDGVLADFEGALANVVPDPPEMFRQGFFRSLKVMPGAKLAVNALLSDPGLRVYVGSKHSAENAYSATEKLQWIEEHFPSLLKRIVLVCDKGLLRGDYLVDDDAHRWEKKFIGEFIHFDRYEPYSSWVKVCQKLVTGFGVL